MSKQKSYPAVWGDDEVRPVSGWCTTDGISPSTARRLIATGKITVTHLSDRRIAIRGRDRRRWLDAGASNRDTRRSTQSQ
jgi:predicted site-specific integrase-resolvase